MALSRRLTPHEPFITTLHAPGDILGLDGVQLLPLERIVDDLLHQDNSRKTHQLAKDLQERTMHILEVCRERFSHDRYLSVDEVGAIRLYTAEFSPKKKSLYAVLNRTLRKKGDRNSAIRPFLPYLKLFLSATTKLPRIPVRVYRGVGISFNLDGRFKNDDTFRWWDIVSCSKNAEEARKFAAKCGDIFFTIKCKSAVSIKQYSEIAMEDEVLLLPGTAYKVFARAAAGDGQRRDHVILEEIDPSPVWEAFKKDSAAPSWTRFFSRWSWPRNTVVACAMASFCLFLLLAFWLGGSTTSGLLLTQSSPGVAYKHGDDVGDTRSAQDKWYEKTALKGDPDAQYRMGLDLEDEDPEKAVEWYKKAAEQHHVEAQIRLGICYENGKGVKSEDTQKAEQLYRTAIAEHDHREAWHRLGVWYAKGYGGKGGEKQAVKCWRKAANLGHMVAQYNMGQCCRLGNCDGQRRDVAEARKWYRKAKKQGCKKSEYVLRDL